MNFDYIIVGGGTAGCLVADYLSKKNHKVAIVEKGTNNKLLNYLVEQPNGTFFTLRNKIFTKIYLTERNKNVNGRKIKWPRGEYMGGSSAINGLVYKRGHKLDYDNLYNQGFLSWEWKKVKKYYEEIEERLKIYNYKSSGVEAKNKIVIAFLESLKIHNFNECKSFNENLETTKSICSHYDLTINNFKRSYAYNVYIKNNKNITIFYKSLVSKIIIKDSTAIGIEYLKNKKKEILYCKKEVILSAGTINSPKILQLSGIGDSDLLKSLKINVIKDNKNVGKNLRDHMQVKIPYKINSNENFNHVNKNFSSKVIHFLRSILFKKGILTLGAIRAGGFVGSNHGENKHNFQINLLLATAESGIEYQGLNKIDKFNGITISINNLNPESSGFIKIKSKDPSKDPYIQPNYFSNSNDINKFLKGIRLIRKIAKTKPISEIIIEEVVPGRFLNNDKDLIDFIKDTAETIYHPTGTCRIGTDETGVVDGNLKVIGIKNLRVCDASVFPNSMSGNMVAPCYLAGMVLVKDILS